MKYNFKDLNGTKVDGELSFTVGNSTIVVNTVTGLCDIIENGEVVVSGIKRLQAALTWVSAFGMRD